MFELGIFCVFLLAAGYWATLWFMGRHDDVLHGKFVHPELAVEGAAPEVPVPPPFPARPVGAVAPPRIEPERVDSEALQSLLAAIKQDLRDVA